MINQANIGNVSRAILTLVHLFSMLRDRDRKRERGDGEEKCERTEKETECRDRELAEKNERICMRACSCVRERGVRERGRKMEKKREKEYTHKHTSPKPTRPPDVLSLSSCHS